MHVHRNRYITSSILIILALFLSVSLLQITQMTALSAPQPQSLEEEVGLVNVFKYTLGDEPSTSWEFLFEGLSGYTHTITVNPVDGVGAALLPPDRYTVTEVPKPGYIGGFGVCDYEEITSAAEVGPPVEGWGPTIIDVYPFETAYCYFLNAQYASMTITKEAVPESPQPFHYHLDWSATELDGVNEPQVNASQEFTGRMPFTLIDDGTGISNTLTLTEVVPGGIYSVTEAPVEGWLQESVVCETDIYTGSYDIPFWFFFLIEPPIRGALVTEPESIIGPYTLGPGDAVTCTVTNIAPQIELTKTVGTDPATCATESTIDVFTGTEVYYCYEIANTGGVTLTTHSLTDDVLDDLLTDYAYDLYPGDSINTVVDASLVVTDAPIIDTTNVATWTGVSPEFLQGEEAITLTAQAEAVAQVNVYEPSRIIIDKVTQPDSSEDEFTFEWGLAEGTPTEVILSDTDEPYVTPDLFPGTYVVSERVPTMWELIESTCEDASGATYLPNAIELGEGVEVTCTFTNELDIPTALDETDMPSETPNLFLPWMGASE